MQREESSDANSELFKEDHDEVLHKNACKNEICDVISVSYT